MCFWCGFERLLIILNALLQISHLACFFSNRTRNPAPIEIIPLSCTVWMISWCSLKRLLTILNGLLQISHLARLGFRHLAWLSIEPIEFADCVQCRHVLRSPRLLFVVQRPLIHGLGLLHLPLSDIKFTQVVNRAQRRRLVLWSVLWSHAFLLVGTWSRAPSSSFD